MFLVGATGNLILRGDFNTDLSKKSSHLENLLSKIESRELSCKSNYFEYTRVTPKTKSTSDVFF